jgi:2-polyprenyl-3-methyl-5-hydroxy-6-metoxy-1,4-benzoquinol methylase
MGCGGASIIEGLGRDSFASILGIDLSQEAIRLAGRYAAERISFQQADMETFECPHPFDVILFSESLNYVPVTTQVSFLQRLAQNLKPGGAFIVTLAQAARYAAILENIRKNFNVLEDRSFSDSSRHLIVFNQGPTHD